MKGRRRGREERGRQGAKEKEGKEKRGGGGEEGWREREEDHRLWQPRISNRVS